MQVKKSGDIVEGEDQDEKEDKVKDENKDEKKELGGKKVDTQVNRESKSITNIRVWEEPK